jgi:hypothetical protein
VAGRHPHVPQPGLSASQPAYRPSRLKRDVGLLAVGCWPLPMAPP